MKVFPYLIFAGNAEEVINFYIDNIGGTIELISRFADAPMPSTDEQKNKVLHARFTIGDSLIMASDGQPGETYSGDNISLSVDFSDVDEMKQKFEKLAEGGKITMAVQDTFWGATFGMLTDKYGIQWMFNCDKKPEASTADAADKTLDITA